MATCAAPLPNTQRTQAQRDLVINHNQIARRIGIKLFHQRLNRDAAQVHERFRLGQHDLPAGNPGGGRKCPAATVVHRHPTLLRQPVDSQKTRVMGGELVFDTWVSQADHQGRTLSFPVHYVSQAQSQVTSFRPFPQPRPESRSCPSWPLPAPLELLPPPRPPPAPLLP